jgi:hypothetical protein
MTISCPNGSTAENSGVYERIADLHGRNRPDASAAIAGPGNPDRQAGDRRRCREKRTIRFSTRNSGAAVPVPKIPMIRRPEQDSACSTEAMGQLQIIAQWVARILHGTGFQFAFYHHPV